jgi:hypothetical protein
MGDTMSGRILIFASIVLVSFCFAWVTGCGSSEETSTQAPIAVEEPEGTSMQEISVEGRRCLELVKAKKYAEAIDPCERALRQAASTDVERAYEEAKAAVKAEAQSAAATTAADTLSGKPADEAAGDAARNALGNLSGD